MDDPYDVELLQLRRRLQELQVIAKKRALREQIKDLERELRLNEVQVPRLMPEMLQNVKLPTQEQLQEQLDKHREWMKQQRHEDDERS